MDSADDMREHPITLSSGDTYMLDKTSVYYDINSLQGDSGGAVVMTKTGQVVAMHLGFSNQVKHAVGLKPKEKVEKDSETSATNGRGYGLRSDLLRGYLHLA